MVLLSSDRNTNNRGAPLEDFPEVGWDKAMSLNVKAIFYCRLSPKLRLSNTPNCPANYVNNSNCWVSYGCYKDVLHISYDID